jgi:hypothetical protein
MPTLTFHTLTGCLTLGPRLIACLDPTSEQSDIREWLSDSHPAMTSWPIHMVP